MTRGHATRNVTLNIGSQNFMPFELPFILSLFSHYSPTTVLKQFFKVDNFFLLKIKFSTPECKSKKLKNALNLHKQKTYWSYFVSTRRNLDFRGRGSHIFELPKWRILSHKIINSSQNIDFWTIDIFHPHYFPPIHKLQ